MIANVWLFFVAVVSFMLGLLIGGVVALAVLLGAEWS